MRRHPSALFGLLLVGIGALLLLQQTGAIDEDIGLGPLILMVVGGWLFLARLSAGSRWGNAGGYVVPLVLFGIGFVLLLRDTGAIDEDVEIWPVVLIAIGAGIVIGALPRRRGNEGTARSERVAVPLQGATEAHVVVKHGAGELRVRSGASEGSVVEGRFGAGVQTRVDRRGERVDVILDGPWSDWWFPGNWGPHGAMEWDVELNRSIPIALEVKAGANAADLDLSELQVRDLLLETGASKTSVTLPSHGRVKARVKGGAASFRIRVPEGVAARIRVAAGVSSVKVDEARFPRSGLGFESAGFDEAENRVELELNVGAADVDIR